MKRTGRNDLCDCGSGKKFKHCCQPQLQADAFKAGSNAALISNTFRTSLDHHQAGRLTHAEAGYRDVLQQEPNHADALHLLGVLARQNGHPDMAIELIERALTIKPNYAEAYNNLGIALKETGQLDASILSYQRALKLKRDLVDAHYNLGIAFKEQGKLDEAIASYRQALKVRPGYAEAHNNLGIVFKQQGKLKEAVACHEKAIRLKPNFAEAHNNLGVAFKAQGDYDMAVASYQRAIELRPDFFEAYNNLGNALQEQGRMDEALKIYVKALGYEPNSYEAHNNLGAVFEDQGEFDRAFACYQRSLELNPDYAEAYNNLGNVLRRQGKIEEAVTNYRTAVRLKPDYVVVHSNLGNALKEFGDVDAAMTVSQHAWALDPEGFSGLVSVIRLAVLYYLKGNVSKADEALALSQYVLTAKDEKFAAPKEYWMLLHKLMHGEATKAVDDDEQQVGETLYVIGESHMLSVHNLSFIHEGLRLRCQGRWIEGCKQWHLANSENNAYKYQLRKFLGSIPHQAKIVLTIGEIDCRTDEGILPAWKKSHGKSIEDIACNTVTGYLNYVSHVAKERNQKLIICGVPAPNIRLDSLFQENAEQISSLVAYFNYLLREHSVANGLGFIDLFAMTDCGAGRSDGRWHLDSHHLRPDAYLAAFKKYFLGTALHSSVPIQPSTMSIEEALQKAVALHQEGRFQDAENLYRAILKTYPDNADANHNLGVLFVQQGHPESSLEYLKKALEANPGQAQYWLSYVEALIQAGCQNEAIHVLQQGQERGLQGDMVDQLVRRLTFPSNSEIFHEAFEYREAGCYQEGIDCLQNWLASHDDDAEAYAHLAQLFSLNRQDEKAWGAINSALFISSSLPAVQRNFSRLLLRRQNLTESVAAANAAYQSSPLDPENQLVLAAALGANGNIADAFSLLNSLLEIRPSYAEALASRAMLRLQQGDLTGGLVDAESALVSKPHLIQLWPIVSSLRFQKRDLPGAIAALGEALHYEPDNVDWLSSLGELKRQSGHVNEATELFKRAVALAPDNATGWSGLAMSFHQAKLFTDAEVAYRRALAIQPGQLQAAKNLGVILKESGRRAEAEIIYREILELRPDDAEAYTNLGVILYEDSRLSEAESCLRQALKLNQDLVEAHNNLANVLREQGRMTEARDYVDRALIISPEMSSAHHTLGNLLKEEWVLGEAEASYIRAMSLNPTGFSGLDSAIKLAILSYLKNDLPQAGKMLERGKAIFEQTEQDFRASKIYHVYLRYLLDWWAMHGESHFIDDRGAEALYVIGESHMLTTHNLLLRHVNRLFRSQGTWIEGCKQWHLGSNSHNKYKYQLDRILKSIPKGSEVLVTIGEIDCRWDGGMMQFFKKSSDGKSINEIAMITACNYLTYIQQLNCSYGHHISICGIPATNVSVEKMQQDKDLFLQLLMSFNGILKEKTLDLGMGFLDVFAMTDGGGGISNKRWHIDTHHLRPDAIVEAFDSYFFQ